MTSATDGCPGCGKPATQGHLMMIGDSTWHTHCIGSPVVPPEDAPPRPDAATASEMAGGAEVDREAADRHAVRIIACLEGDGPYFSKDLETLARAYQAERKRVKELEAKYEPSG